MHREWMLQLRLQYGNTDKNEDAYLRWIETEQAPFLIIQRFFMCLQYNIYGEKETIGFWLKMNC